MVDFASAKVSLTSPLWEPPALRCGCSVGDTSSLHPAGGGLNTLGLFKGNVIGLLLCQHGHWAPSKQSLIPEP